MDWLTKLFLEPESIAHIVLLYALVITIGVYLGKIKVCGISLGVTFVLFAGIIAGHFGMTGTLTTLNFIQDFGLILFVYCIGLQVGPSFFSSFKEGGVSMNLIAVGIIALDIVVMLLFYWFGFEHTGENLAMMVGVLCGAVTNTPGLGAANEALSQIAASTGKSAPQIASAYACAYPLAVVGMIGCLIALKFILRVNTEKEENELNSEESDPKKKPHMMHLEMTNPSLDGKKLVEVKNFMGRQFVISRILQDGHVSIPNRDTVFHMGDQMFVVCAEDDYEPIVAFIGKVIEVDWEKQDTPMVSRRILVTQESINGKTLGQLHLSSVYGVNVTRVNRAGMNIFASDNFRLQLGDRVMTVGPEDAVQRVANLLGNSLRKLDHPNLATIFVGIFIGIIFGMIPIAIPGIPTPVKLGLAGGPLVIAILIGAFGYKIKLPAYTTMSANLMLREIGLVLFLASVGIKAGATFVDTVLQGDGLKYVAYGFFITIIPILIMGVIARWRYKMNYFTLIGLIAGSNTDPPALAYSNSITSTSAPAVGYSTVYPLAMFLRIVTAQIIILLLCSL